MQEGQDGREGEMEGGGGGGVEGIRRQQRREANVGVGRQSILGAGDEWTDSISGHMLDPLKHPPPTPRQGGRSSC